MVEIKSKKSTTLFVHVKNKKGRCKVKGKLKEKGITLLALIITKLVPTA